MAPGRMIHEGPASGPRPRFNDLEFTDEGRVVEKIDAALSDEGLKLRVGRGLVHVLRFAGHAKLGIAVLDALGLEAIPHPRRRITIAKDDPKAVGSQEIRDVAHDGLKVHGRVATPTPRAHDVVDEATLGPFAFSMDD